MSQICEAGGDMGNGVEFVRTDEQLHHHNNLAGRLGSTNHHHCNNINPGSTGPDRCIGLKGRVDPRARFVGIHSGSEANDMLQQDECDHAKEQYIKAHFDEISKEVYLYLKKVGYYPENIPFVPISGFEGDNMIEKSSNLDWYKRPTLLEALDNVSEPKRPSECRSVSRSSVRRDRWGSDLRPSSDLELQPEWQLG